jgi:Ca2+-dependent lipid-binding protein
VPRIFGNSLFDIIVTGKSDPFAVFSLNSQKVFKSQTKKKTLNPDWNENFVASIVSRFEIRTDRTH